MRRIGFCLLLGILLAGCAADPSARAEIEAAAAASVRENGGGSVRVEVDGVAGDHARARVSPADGSTDTAWVFLRREGAGWTGIALGTAFAPEDYRELSRASSTPRSYAPWKTSCWMIRRWGG